MPNLWGTTITGATVVTAILWLFEHPEIYDRIKAGLIKPFIKGRKRVQQHYIASDLQSRLNTFSRHIAKEMDEKQLYRARVQWVEVSAAPETFFEQDQLVIRMDCADNACKNLTMATLAYVSSVLAKNAKPFADPLLRRAIDLMSTKKILDASANENEKHYFNNVFLFPTLESDSDLKHDCEGISLLDQKGYFTRLFLRELRYIGDLLKTTIPTDDIQDELRAFFQYLIIISNAPILQEGGTMLTHSQFQFKRRYLKVQVVLFAMPMKVQSGDIRPYRRRVKQGLKEGIEIFYILASEQSFQFLDEFEKDIKKRLVKQRILKKTSDRTFYLWRSHRQREKHRCLVYRKLSSLEDIDLDEILEKLPDEENPTEERQSSTHVIHHAGEQEGGVYSESAARLPKRSP